MRVRDAVGAGYLENGLLSDKSLVITPRLDLELNRFVIVFSTDQCFTDIFHIARANGGTRQQNLIMGVFT